jgi:parvulin-like peptidyl-prolyl isomerase
MTSTSTRVISVLAVAFSLSGGAFAQQTPAAPDTKPAPTTPAPPDSKPAQTTPTSTPQPVNIKPAPPAGRPPQVPPVNLPKPKPLPKLPPNIVARVGTQNITREDALAMFNMVGGRPIVDQLVQSALLEQEAKRLGVTVSEDELQQAINKAKLAIVGQQEAMGTRLDFKEIAEREGFNDELIRWSVRLDILRRKTFTKAVEKQIPTRDGQLHLAHILAATIPLPKPGEESKPLTPEEQKKKDEDAKAKIDRLLDDIKSGRKTWDEAAKESDDSTNAQNGGDLQWYGKGQLDPAFEKAAWSIEKTGEIVGPVKSSFGWHLIKLVQKGSDLTPKEKADYRQQQLAMLQSNQQQMTAWMNSLRTGKQVIINRQVQVVPGAKLPAWMLATTPSSGKPAAKSSAKNSN